MRINLTILFFTSLLLTGCNNGIFYDPPTPAEYCGSDPVPLEPEPEGEGEVRTVLKLWSNQERQYCWRTFAPVQAAKQQPELKLDVREKTYQINATPFKDKLIESAEDHKAPDIAFTMHREARLLGEAGYLYPLDECRQRPEFASIPDKFWTGFTADGQTWGIPIGMEVMLLFYNKTLLHQLGWSQSKIDAFPAQIARGDYTLDDLVATSREAIDSGVVKPGLAFMPTLNQYATIESLYAHMGGRFTDDAQRNFVIDRKALEAAYSFLAQLHKYQLFDARMAIPTGGNWGDNLLLRDAAVHDRYLFWHTYISERQGLVIDYMDSPQDAATLDERIGVSLLPSSIRGEPGYSRLVNYGQYVIFNKQATGRAHQQAACDLLAATQASGLLKHHTDRSGHPTFADDGFYVPEWFPPPLPLETLLWPSPRIENFETYINIQNEVAIRVESGELTASEAADVAVERLRDALGSQLIVE